MEKHTIRLQWKASVAEEFCLQGGTLTGLLIVKIDMSVNLAIAGCSAKRSCVVCSEASPRCSLPLTRLSWIL